MFIEGISSVKLLATVLTFVCFVLFMMNNPVIVKTVFGDKPLSTNTAQEGITVRMVDLVMQSSITGSFQNLVAHFALKSLPALFTMRKTFVGFQSLPRSEISATDLTCVLGGFFLGFLLLVLQHVLGQRLLVGELTAAAGALVHAGLGAVLHLDV